MPKLPDNITLYLVEDGDDERERVIKMRVGSATLDVNPEYETIEDYLGTVAEFETYRTVTLTVDVAPNEDGVYFTVENYNKDD